MRIMLKETTYASLTEMARSARQNPDFAAALCNQGSEILSQALDLFARERVDIDGARKAIEEMSDLENAMKACIDSVQAGREANHEKIRARDYEIRRHGYEEGLLKAGAEEKLENAPRLAFPGHQIVGEKTVTRGRRVISEEETHIELGKTRDEMEGVRKFIVDLHELIGLYASLTLVPGPLSRVLTRYIQTQLKGQQAQAPPKEAKPEGKSQGQGKEKKAEAPKIAIPVPNPYGVPASLLELRSRLQQIRTTEPTEGEIQARRTIREYGMVTKGVFKNHEVEEILRWIPSRYAGYGYQPNSAVGSITESRTLEKHEVDPEHVWLPESSTAAYQIKKG